MIKELTPQEVARKLADEGCFDGYVRNDECSKWKQTKITGIDLSSVMFPIKTIVRIADYIRCAIEIPDKYVPYPDDEFPPLKCGDVIVYKDNKEEYLVCAVDKRKGIVAIEKGWVTKEMLFKYYTYLDGSPIGKLEE